MFAEVVFHKLVTCVNELNEHTIATIADKLHEYLMVQCILPVPVSKAVVPILNLLSVTSVPIVKLVRLGSGGLR